MTYKVEFEVDGDAVSYTVRAENVLKAEELAKEQLKQDKNVRGKAYRRGSSTSSWEVKHIENIQDGREGR
jgi:hypothetical protein